MMTSRDTVLLGAGVLAAALFWRSRAAVAGSPQVELFARAIAFAEGYGRPDAIPTRRNNPGDLILPGESSPHTFATIEQGWAALYHQVELMFSGRSAHFSPSMSIAETADIYTGHDAPLSWARNVAAYLSSHGMPGVQVTAELRAIASRSVVAA